MTDTQTDTARHELLPGTSAYALWRTASIVSTVLSVGVGLSIGYLRFQYGDETNPPAYVWLYLAIPIAIDVVVSIVLFRAANRRTKAETAAGYTTRTSGFNNVDQVDPKSGVVLRKAGSAVLTLPAKGEDATSALGLQLDAPRFTADPIMRRRRILFWIVGPVAAIVIFGGGFASAGGGAMGAIVLGGSFALIVLIVIVTYASVAVYMGGYLRTARNGDPSKYVFLSANTPEFRAAAFPIEYISISRLVCPTRIHSR